MRNKPKDLMSGGCSLGLGIFLGVLLISLLSGGGSSSLNAAASSPTPEAATELPRICLPPEGKIYHAAFPDGKTGEEDDITPDDLRSYEETVGKSVTWVYFSHNWYKDRLFPLETASWIRETGSVPFITVNG